jgi:hypothetical protein
MMGYIMGCTCFKGNRRDFFQILPQVRRGKLLFDFLMRPGYKRFVFLFCTPGIADAIVDYIVRYTCFKGMILNVGVVPLRAPPH